MQRESFSRNSLFAGCSALLLLAMPPMGAQAEEFRTCGAQSSMTSFSGECAVPLFDPAQGYISFQHLNMYLIPGEDLVEYIYWENSNEFDEFRCTVFDPTGVEYATWQSAEPAGWFTLTVDEHYPYAVGEWTAIGEGRRLIVPEYENSRRHVALRGSWEHVGQDLMHVWSEIDVDLEFENQIYGPGDEMRVSWEVLSALHPDATVYLQLQNPLHVPGNPPTRLVVDSAPLSGEFTFTLGAWPIHGDWRASLWIDRDGPSNPAFVLSPIQTATTHVEVPGEVVLGPKSRVFEADQDWQDFEDEDLDGIPDEYEHDLASIYRPLLKEDYYEETAAWEWTDARPEEPVLNGKLLTYNQIGGAWANNEHAVYYKVRPVGDQLAGNVWEAAEIQYWFASSYNEPYAWVILSYDWLATHVWDMEMIAAKIFNTDATDSTPAELWYNYHFDGTLLDDVNQWHPDVYIAAGSHASYWWPGHHFSDSGWEVEDFHRGNGMWVGPGGDEDYRLWNLGEIDFRFDGTTRGFLHSHPGMDWVHIDHFDGWCFPDEDMIGIGVDSPHNPFGGNHDDVRVSTWGYP